MKCWLGVGLLCAPLWCCAANEGAQDTAVVDARLRVLADSVRAVRSHPGKAEALQRHGAAMLRLATNLGDTAHIIMANTALGLASMQLGDDAKAAEHHTAGLRLAQQAHRSNDEAVACANLGNLSFRADRADDATRWMLRAVRAFVGRGDLPRAAACYSNLAFYLRALGDSARALDYSRQAFALQDGRMDDVTQLGVAANLFTALVDAGRGEEAAALGARVLERCGTLDAPREQAQVHMGLAVLDMQQGRTEAAMEGFGTAMRMAGACNDASTLTKAGVRMAEALERSGRPGEALDHLMRADSIARSRSDHVSMGRIAAHMHPLLAKLGRFDEAYAWMKTYHAAYDSLIGAERATEVERLRETFEAERREEELQVLRARDAALEVALRRRNYLLAAAGGMVALGLVAGVFWHGRRMERHRRAVQESRLTLLRTQLDPHFIFNVLTTLQRAVMRGAGTAELSRMFANFGAVIRAFLEFNREETIPLQREIDVLEKYIETQKLRFEEGFSHSIEVGPGIDPNEVMVPPMLLQPFVENAVEHGIRDAGAQGAVRIRYGLHNGSLAMTVSDNGLGLARPAVPNAGKRPLATHITRERIRLLNSIGKGGYRFDVRNAQGAGTEVYFEIPLVMAA